MALASKKLEIRLGDVSLSFEYENIEQLKKELEQVPQAKEAMKEALAGIVDIKNVKVVRADLEDVCSTDGKYFLFKLAPEKDVDKAILAIYFYGASATLEEIARTTGIQNPSSNVLRSGKNSDYFVTLEKGTYGLSKEGFEQVTNKILPEIRKRLAEQRGKGETSNTSVST